MSKRHYGQESPRDQLYAQIGAIRGEAQNILEDIAQDPKKNAQRILGLLDAMQGVLPHIENVKWNPELPKEWEYKGADE